MFTRENHLGIAMDSPDQATFRWIVPDLPAMGIDSSRCAFRIRYNISSEDYNSWDSGVVNASLNDREGLKLNLTARFKSEFPYPFKNNPTVNIGNGLDLELAINTAQIGRTFQDRSHRFSIVPSIPMADLPFPSSKIYNLNVMGKRGNIVQTFPAQEYFYVPEVLHASTGDLVHIQWSGSNTNPDNNAGEGQQGSDRHNMMETHSNDLGRVKPSHLEDANLFNSTMPYSGIRLIGRLSTQPLGRHPALTDPYQLGGQMSQLDDAGTYFSGNLFQLTSTGTFHYMNSRNNNFSNRQQKATVVIHQGPTFVDTGFIVGISVTSVIVAALIVFGAFSAYQHFTVAPAAAAAGAGAV
jgi:hypothetical protein